MNDAVVGSVGGLVLGKDDDKKGEMENENKVRLLLRICMNVNYWSHIVANIFSIQYYLLLKNNRDMWDEKLKRKELLDTEDTDNVAQGSGM